MAEPAQAIGSRHYRKCQQATYDRYHQYHLRRCPISRWLRRSAWRITKWARTREIIAFTEENLKEVRVLHDDPIIISLTIANFNVKKILVDNGSLTNILFYDTFQRMKLSYDQLQKINAPLVRFTRSSFQVEGAINLPVMIKTKPCQSTVKLTFLVVRVSSAYNTILEQLGLNALRAIVSTYHLLMNFPTMVGIKKVWRDQMLAR